MSTASSKLSKKEMKKAEKSENKIEVQVSKFLNSAPKNIRKFMLENQLMMKNLALSKSIYPDLKSEEVKHLNDGSSISISALLDVPVSAGNAAVQDQQINLQQTVQHAHNHTPHQQINFQPTVEDKQMDSQQTAQHSQIYPQHPQIHHPHQQINLQQTAGDKQMHPQQTIQHPQADEKLQAVENKSVIKRLLETTERLETIIIELNQKQDKNANSNEQAIKNLNEQMNRLWDENESKHEAIESTQNAVDALSQDFQRRKQLADIDSAYAPKLRHSFSHGSRTPYAIRFKPRIGQRLYSRLTAEDGKNYMDKNGVINNDILKRILMDNYRNNWTKDFSRLCDLKLEDAERSVKQGQHVFVRSVCRSCKVKVNFTIIDKEPVKGFINLEMRSSNGSFHNDSK